jgi:proteasome lid subunit RPN8/RPN11
VEPDTFQNDFGARRMRVIRLSKHQDLQIRQHGESEFPHECCGVILGDLHDDATVDVRIVRELRPLSNVHEDGHERRYLVSPDEMFALLREERKTGRKILGFYHSHPNHPAQPSIYDRDWASPWYTYIIVSVIDGSSDVMTAWRLEENRENFAAEELVTENPVTKELITNE